MILPVKISYDVVNWFMKKKTNEKAKEKEIPFVFFYFIQKKYL